MILQILGFGFFALLWLMAARGLIEAAGPFNRRLEMLLGRLELRHGSQHHAFPLYG